MIVNRVLDDADAAIEVHPDQRLVRLLWKRPSGGANYRTVLDQLLDLVRTQGLRLWLSDGRRAGPITAEDEEWTMKTFTPRVMEAGLEKIAIVNSEDVLNKIAVDRMVKATPASAPYEIGFFEDPAIAQLWLMDPSRGARA